MGCDSRVWDMVLAQREGTANHHKLKEGRR